MPEQVFSNRYEIQRHIARGGMAEVYLARDLLLDRPVALKVLFRELSADPSFVARFRREAQSAANLSHPNIVNVYDWGEEGQTYFIVMEFVDGRTLRDLIRAEGPLHPDRAADIAVDIAAALDFAHRNDVIHRDVKPGNVLLTSTGQVKVTDFGIARAARDAQDNLTQTGQVMGTATYFSPEQAQGLAIAPTSDVYSLGVVLYEMVTGGPPFTGDNPVAIAYQHVREDAEPPSRRNPDVPADFESIVLKAIAKSPDDRYTTAEELSADLQRYRQGGRVTAATAVVPPPPGPDVTQAVAPVTAAAATTVARTTSPARSVMVEEDVPVMEPPPPPRRTGAYIALLVVLLGLLAVLLFFLARNLGVGDDDGGGGTVEVPTVVGVPIADAERSLRGAGLEPERIDQPNDGAEVGIVFRADPQQGTSVDRDTTVKLYVSAGAAPVPVPDVRNQDAADATELLKKNGFVVTSTSAPNDVAKPGTVVEQNPPPATEAKRGDTVALTVSGGPEKKPVPDVTGKTAAEAANILGQAGFGTDTRDLPSDRPQGTIVRTDPPAGTQAVPRDTRVTLFVAIPDAVAVPDVEGASEADARAQLTGAGFKVAVQRREVADPSDDGKVVDQIPVPGTSAARGSTVTIVVGRSIVPVPTTSTTSTTTP